MNRNGRTRLDVFHQLPRSVAGWNDTATSITNDVRDGVGRPPWWYARYRPELVLEKCIRSTTAPSNRRVLGVVAMWGHLTTEQVAAATDLPVAKALNTLRRLHVAGLLRRTSLVFRRNHAAQLEVWSLAPDSDGPLATLQRRLPFDIWTDLTAGWPPRPSPPQSWTHDIVAAEIALRLINTTSNITAAWGVHCADVGLLTGQGRSTGTRQNAVADAVLIRHDGLPIALEVQRSFTGPAITTKLQRWVELIRAHREHAPAVVWIVFDDAAAPNRTHHRGFKTRVAELVRANPTPVIRHQIAERIGVVHWTDWFPASHTASATFAELGVQRATGPAGQPWNPALMLDAFDTPFTAIDRDRWMNGIVRSLDWDGALTPNPER